ncbi:cadherin-23-like isoform X2 [Leptopilina heterotoma]|uniref:cadherin-23-like isoform X2 n=1 Tax=Leptopilina heterotoma TaxID=63436 RepID=UPI001CA9E5CE|nr:cadherin-23-like isoform X2 [Leptopilina heterotoma]
MVKNIEEWPSPGFKEPPTDKEIISWEYLKEANMAVIGLNEEADHNVTIAVFNYEGTEEPQINKFENSVENNENLGAEFVKNNNGIWEIVITKKQDYETQVMRSYTMTVIIPLIANSYKVRIVVINIDDNAPVIQANEKQCSIEENYVGLSSCTFTITDVDGWIDSTTFTLTSTPTSGVENFAMVPGNILSNYKMNAILNTMKSLDFETISVYTLGIIAKDRGNNTSNNLITVVKVIDLPDMPPMWTNLIAAKTIFEKSINNFQVTAIDGDHEINAAINYRIVNLESKHDFFQVKKETGEITIKEIDRDALKQEIFKFIIIAYEVDDTESSINSTIVIVVNDINDHSPEIKPSILAINILEETYMNLEFNETITIEDPDLAENAQFDVKLENEGDVNWKSAFIIIPNSAYQLGTFTISVVNASLLDYEDEKWRNMKLKIVATERADASHVGTRDIVINLINWNDELPIFQNDNVTISIKEDVELDYSVATVFAKDRDFDDSVTHSLVSNRGLKINSVTGEISTTEKKSFDYEAMPIVHVQVVATDNANHKTFASLTINIIDVNDKQPSLFLPQEKPSLQEEVSFGTKVITSIYAKDLDTEAELKFSIDWNSSTAQRSNSLVDDRKLFEKCLTIETNYRNGKKGEADAQLVVNGRIDYEAFDTLFLTIVVTDLTTVHNADFNSASLTLLITDINDNAPEFGEVAEMKIQENQKSNIFIGRITAYDIDGPGNNDVTYSLKPVNGTADKLVQIDPKKGDIKVDKDGAIDAEIYEFLSYHVTATDGLHNTVLPIQIYVIDENDEYPAALAEKFPSEVHIKERSKTGTKIVQVFALDKDRTSPFNNVSYLINSDYPQLFQYFSIDKFNGWLEVNLIDDAILDRDRGPSSYTVYLKLRDNFIEELSYNSNLNTTIVTVVLEDINNQIPELPELPIPAMSVSENTNEDALLLTITADDKDDPNTVNTKVFYEIKEIIQISNHTVTPQENWPVLFKVKTVNQKNAEIRTNCHLKGYYGVWGVKLYVQDLGVDPGPLNDTKIYNIQINDYNYHDPVIIYPSANKAIRLSQIQEINSELKTYDGELLESFTATDEDFGESGKVTFSLSGNDAKNFRIIPLENNQAQLQLITIPDVSKQRVFNPLVTVTDHGQPKQRSKTQTQKIIFVSTNGPEFEQNTFTTWFHENTTGLSNFTIIPEAKDLINEGIEEELPVNVFYFLESDEGDMSFFSLNKETRNLTLKKELDREVQETMILRVIATTNPDGPNSNPREKAILKITVNVVDVNDNSPIFVSKTYFGGVALEDAVGKVILTVNATDADFNDTLSYKIRENSLSMSDSSLEGISVPFLLKISTGELSLGFKPTSYMTGYFSMDILVNDEVSHEDSSHVKIYMIAKDNRVVFTFRNKLTVLNELKSYIIKTFSEIFGYICNIDYIEKSITGRDVSEDVTLITTHFINAETNLPVSADKIILKVNNVETISNLSNQLKDKKLLLVDVPTSTQSKNDEDNHDIVQWILLFLTTFFFIVSISLLIAYIVRVRGLTEKLDKLAITNYDSPDPTIEKIAVMPNANKFALEGSNPMWKTENLNEMEDNISHGSGDSDLIGVEDNPDFDYESKRKNENMEKKLNPLVLPNFSTNFSYEKSTQKGKSISDEYTC